jgi:hypothetical protein
MLRAPQLLLAVSSRDNVATPPEIRMDGTSSVSPVERLTQPASRCRIDASKAVRVAESVFLIRHSPDPCGVWDQDRSFGRLKQG